MMSLSTYRLLGLFVQAILSVGCCHINVTIEELHMYMYMYIVPVYSNGFIVLKNRSFQDSIFKKKTRI